MGSLTNLVTFQAMAWMYIDATMQRCAVLRSDNDGISVDVVHYFGHKWVVNTGVCLLSFRVLGSVYE